MKGYKKLLGKGTYAGRFYNIKVKVKDDDTKVVSIRRISEPVYNALVITNFDGQVLLNNYMTNQAEAMEESKKEAMEKKNLKIAEDEAKKSKSSVKLTWWQKIKAFFANLLGKKK